MQTCGTEVEQDTGKDHSGRYEKNQSTEAEPDTNPNPVSQAIDKTWLSEFTSLGQSVTLKRSCFSKMSNAKARLDHPSTAFIQNICQLVSYKLL